MITSTKGKQCSLHTILHEDEFLRIFKGSADNGIIGINWMEATSEMTDEDFKTELTLFAKQVEDKRAPRILDRCK